MRYRPGTAYTIDEKAPHPMKQTERRRIVVAVAPVGKGDPSPAGNPISPEEVARSVIDCARAGAAMVHLHVRDRAGRQTADLSAFEQTLDMVRESCDIVIQGSTGGESHLQFRPGVSPCATGRSDLSFFSEIDAADRQPLGAGT